MFGDFTGFKGIVNIAGYYDPGADDQNQHVIVATNDGKVTEVWWSAQLLSGRSTELCFDERHRYIRQIAYCKNNCMIQ